MTPIMAAEILGINVEATEQEIRAAYARLIKHVHPEVGGSDFFAKQLNLARDVLLNRRPVGAPGRRAAQPARRPRLLSKKMKIVAIALAILSLIALLCYTLEFVLQD